MKSERKCTFEKSAVYSVVRPCVCMLYILDSLLQIHILQMHQVYFYNNFVYDCAFNDLRARTNDDKKRWKYKNKQFLSKNEQTDFFAPKIYEKLQCIPTASEYTLHTIAILYKYQVHTYRTCIFL